jgi:hypothetical protein
MDLGLLALLRTNNPIPLEVVPLQSIKRDSSFGLSLSAFVFGCALVWGSPFVKPAQAQEQPQQQTPPQQTQPQPDQPPQAQPEQPDPSQGQAQSRTFSGTVVKAGEAYVLRDSSGQIFKLDNSANAKPYEGKPVKVTGQLDEQAMLIHVESIEGAEG